MNPTKPDTVTRDLLVVIPTLGQRDAQLREALESCRELIAQGTTRVVVTAPPSAASSRALASEFAADFVADPGLGMAHAVNQVLALPSGEPYYAWLGDDDRLVTEGVSALLSAAKSDPRAVVAYGFCDYIDQKGRVAITNKAGAWARFFLPWGPNFIPHPGTIIRRDAARHFGFYRTSLLYALDLDLFLSLRSRGPIIHRPVVASQFRWHGDSLTVLNRRASNREAMAVKRAHLASWLRPVSGLWLWPVAWAAQVAAWRLTRRFRRLAREA